MTPAPAMPVTCPSGHPLTWITPNVAVCPGHPRNVWWAKRRAKRWVVEGVWTPAAVELAGALKGGQDG